MFFYEATSVEAFGARAVSLVQVERMRIKLGDSDTTSLDGLIPVTKPMNDETTRKRPEPMEVDALTNRYADEEEDDGEELCKCAAMQEKGFHRPCYYCSRRGHMVRSCPRKAAGLPKVLNPANNRRPRFQNKMNIQRGPNCRSGDKNGPNNGQFHGYGAKPKKRVQQLDDGEDDEPEAGAEGDEEVCEEYDTAAHF